ncbi:hypothetical protein OHA61_22335 [Streptomyces sp. NBC_00885]|nr:hypothetical protein OHA61_22335 [Streptomyces sp. NBC_00885]
MAAVLLTVPTTTATAAPTAVYQFNITMQEQQKDTWCRAPSANTIAD